MPKVKITTDEETGDFAIEYECECGQKLKLITPIRPKKLVKCFECQTPVAEIGETFVDYIARVTKKDKKIRR